MTELPSRALADLDHLDDAIVALVEALARYRVTCATTREIVAAGEPVETAFAAARDVNARGTVSDAMLGFERIRYRSRLSLVALSQQEGLSKQHLGELLDISRQLANRWVRESRPLLDDVAVDAPVNGASSAGPS